MLLVCEYFLQFVTFKETANNILQIRLFCEINKMIKIIFKKIKSKLAMILFYARNIIAASRISEINNTEIDDFLFRGYSSLDEDVVAKIYHQLNDGAVFSPMQRRLYHRIGRRCLFVVEQRERVGSSKIVGMNIYYMNKKDIKENTIHEGFIGVVPEASGRGVATKMRQLAIQHFKLAGFSGVSTRISLNNSASLMSAKKIGFEPVEEYQEPSTGEKRYYMICNF